MRSKTVESIRIPQSRNSNKLPTRKLSFNSISNVNSTSQAPVHQSPAPNTKNIEKSLSTNLPNKGKKRSKTLEETKLGKVMSNNTPRQISRINDPINTTSSKPKPKYNPQHYSPKVPSPYLNKTEAIVSKQVKPNNIFTVNPNKLASQIPAMGKGNILRATTVISSDHTEDESKLNKEKTPSVIETNGLNKLFNSNLNKLNKDKLKHSEIKSRIESQRKEMILSKQKNLTELKNQLRIQDELIKKVKLHDVNSHHSLNNVASRQASKINKNFTCKLRKMTV